MVLARGTHALQIILHGYNYAKVAEWQWLLLLLHMHNFACLLQAGCRRDSCCVE